MKHLQLFESFITERKNLGLIYHFTSMSGLEGILKEDTLTSVAFDYLSFTRNSRLNFSDYGIRITFDGDRMSDRFHFEPYLYDGKNWDRTINLSPDKRRDLYGEEREERILKKEIKNIVKYIERVDVLIGEDGLIDRHKKWFMELIQKHPDISFYFVREFKTIKKAA